jgi:hypothetical protein
MNLTNEELSLFKSMLENFKDYDMNEGNFNEFQSETGCNEDFEKYFKKEYARLIKLISKIKVKSKGFLENPKYDKYF